MDNGDSISTRLTRKAFLRSGLAIGGTLLAGAYCPAYPASVTTPRSGGTLKLFSAATIGRIDPIASQLNYLQVVSYNLFGQLVRYKTGTWDVVPDLAERWNVASDGLSVTFRMRPGLKFHDGSAVALSDVRFSLERVFSDPTSVYRELFTAVQSVTADAGNQSVALKLAKPDPFLLPKLAGIGGSAIVPEAAVKKYGDAFATTPENTVASGPFRLTAKTDTSLTWERFPAFPQPSYVDQVVMRIIPDTKTQLLEFDAGNVDWNGSIIDSDVASRYRNDPRYAGHFKQFVSPSKNWFGLNTLMKPFDDVRVRQAFAMAIDPDAIAAVDGTAKASNTLMFSQLQGYKPTAPTYPKNVAKAKTLLNAAGYGGGLKTDFYIYNNDRYISQAEVMQQQLGAIGVQISMRVAEFGAHMSEVRNKKFPFYWTLANVIVPDQAGLIYGSFHSKGPFNPGYQNSEADRLLDQAVGELEIGRRVQLAGSADQVIRRDAGPIYIWERSAVHVFQPWIHGVEGVTAIYPRVRMNEVWLDASHQ